MVQTSSFKMCDFFFLFRVYNWIDFALEKVSSRLPPPSARNLDLTKTAFSEFFFPKNAIDVSATFSCFQKMTQITETKNEQVERSKKLFFQLLQSLSNASKNYILKKMVPAMAYEVFGRNVSSSLHVPFRFWCEFWPKSINRFC